MRADAGHRLLGQAPRRNCGQKDGLDRDSGDDAKVLRRLPSVGCSSLGRNPVVPIGRNRAGQRTLLRNRREPGHLGGSSTHGLGPARHGALGRFLEPADRHSGRRDVCSESGCNRCGLGRSRPGIAEPADTLAVASAIRMSHGCLRSNRVQRLAGNCPEVEAARGSLIPPAT